LHPIRSSFQDKFRRAHHNLFAHSSTTSFRQTGCPAWSETVCEQGVCQSKNSAETASLDCKPGSYKTALTTSFLSEQNSRNLLTPDLSVQRHGGFPLQSQEPGTVRQSRVCQSSRKYPAALNWICTSLKRETYGASQNTKPLGISACITLISRFPVCDLFAVHALLLRRLSPPNGESPFRCATHLSPVQVFSMGRNGSPAPAPALKCYYRFTDASRPPLHNTPQHQTVTMILNTPDHLRLVSPPSSSRFQMDSVIC